MTAWGPFYYVARGDVFDVIYDGSLDAQYHPAHICTARDRAWAEQIARALDESMLKAKSPLGAVIESGGGEVRVLVDRDLDIYPAPGSVVYCARAPGGPDGETES